MPIFPASRVASPMLMRNLLAQYPGRVQAGPIAPGPISGLCVDSRKCRPGMVFVALAGKNHDGMAFAEQARANGASVLLCAEAAMPAVPAGMAAIGVANPRQALAYVASSFFDQRQPACLLGVTGTNGKTSVVHFCAQLLAGTGVSSASLGTLGCKSGGSPPQLLAPPGLTTPDPLILYDLLARCAAVGVTHLAMEVSSHALDQHRVDACRFSVVGFTNLTHDHLDYHPTKAQYLASKKRLFTEIPGKDTSVCLNLYNATGREYARLPAVTVMKNAYHLGPGGAVEIYQNVRIGHKRRLAFKDKKKHYALTLPLLGDFQAENALLAAMMVHRTGVKWEVLCAGMEKLTPVPGRMEIVFTDAQGRVVVVDFAHTPEALEKALRAVRPQKEGRLLVVFGAGGNRDRTKRPRMGKVAARLADIVIVTDDNPRCEDPALIRKDILKGCPQAKEIGERRDAVAYAIGILQPGDCLLVAGRGCETMQEKEQKESPLDDRFLSRSIAQAGWGV